jgi:predicted transcriptional regulator of viral defense system
MGDLPTTNRRRLHERALEQYGYITMRNARELGIPKNAVDAITHRGGLTRVARGVYRFDDVPVTGRDAYMEAVLAAGRGAFLMADAVLSLHDLAQVNPSRIRVGTTRRVRVTAPPSVEIVPLVRVPLEDLTVYEAIPCTTVARALIDCMGIVMRERLLESAREAADRGLLRRSEVGRVLEALGATS